MDKLVAKIEGIFTLRELYAGLALAGLATKFNNEIAIDTAWRLADAMIKHLENEEEARKQQIMFFIKEGKENDR